MPLQAGGVTATGAGCCRAEHCHPTASLRKNSTDVVPLQMELNVVRAQLDRANVQRQRLQSPDGRVCALVHAVPGAGMHGKGGGATPPTPGRPGYAQPLSP